MEHLGLSKNVRHRSSHFENAIASYDQFVVSLVLDYFYELTAIGFDENFALTLKFAHTIG